jgi:hypothetical protein
MDMVVGSVRQHTESEVSNYLDRTVKLFRRHIAEEHAGSGFGDRFERIEKLTGRTGLHSKPTEVRHDSCTELYSI